jgi:nucleotide-binding universal stress UspA family protein
MKTIIVPIDFSEESLPGLDMALMLAGKYGAGIQMVHVIGKKRVSEVDLLEQENKLARMNFEEILLKYKNKINPDSSPCYTILEGKISSEIAEMGDKYEDALMVLSTHGESGFEELFIGGTAYKIISHSHVPIITVRRSRIPSNINRIVMPLDITFNTREKVPYTAGIAKMFNSEIHVITLSLSKIKSTEKKLRQYSAQVASYLTRSGIPHVIEHLHGRNLTDIALEYAISVNADLISIMTDQEKGASNLLLGSYTHQMINRSFIPVLSYPTYRIRVVADDIWTLGAFNY